MRSFSKRALMRVAFSEGWGILNRLSRGRMILLRLVALEPLLS